MATQNAQTPSADKGEKKANPQDTAKGSPEKTQAQIDETAKETFPASDAPASWAGKDIAPQDRKDAQKKS